MALLANIEYVVTLLIVLSILVVAHEWGHFIVARIFGIRVDDFSIGFGKRLVRLGKRGDTEYNLRMLPLGGFVKIAGMAADEEPLVRAKDKVIGKGSQSDPDSLAMPLIAENIDNDSLDHVPAPDEFGSKPLWQRSLVILAGPVMSFVLGYVVFCLMGATVGIPTGKTLNKVGYALPDGAGKKAGLRVGDVISQINGQPITDGQQMIADIYKNPGKPLVLTVVRHGRTLQTTATPQPLKDDSHQPVMLVTVVAPQAAGQALGLKPDDVIGQFNKQDIPVQNGLAKVQTLLRQSAGKTATVNVLRSGEDVPLTGTVPANVAQDMPTLAERETGRLMITPAKEIKQVGLAESFRYGNATLVDTFAGLAYLIQHRQLHQAAGGIIFMYQATGLAVQSGLSDVVSLLASLSISLAVFNMLPIPILDGGHLLSFFIEWVRRGKKMTDQQQQGYLMTGLAIILILFVLIMTNDILRTVHHQLPQ